MAPPAACRGDDPVAVDRVWLGLAAAGLLAYALYCFVEARYRRV